MMDIKRLFGAALVVFGTGSSIYAIVLFINLSGSTHSFMEIIIYCILGVLLLVSGISLIQKVRDD
jgi:uncharacterized membrane protein